MTSRPITRAAVALATLACATAEAQSLSELLPRLLSESVTMPSTAGSVAGNPHEAHFLPAAAQLRAPYALNGAVVSQLSTFPIGSSSGGFTYTLDETTGIPRRSSGNFGPAFAERALTIGKGKLSLGLNYQHVEFDQFEGLDLEGDGPVFYLQHNECCPTQGTDGSPNPAGGVGPTVDANPFFEGDLVRAQLLLKTRTDTAVVFLNYGITDRFDLAVAVPFVRVELDATINSRVLRLATAANPAIHSFGGGSDTRTSRESGSAKGIGDVLVRGKYRVLASTGGGLAVGLDARLPTGDQEDLLGTGATQVKLSLFYSGDYGRFSPHVNVGYTYSSGSLTDTLGTYRLGDEVPAPIPQAPNAYSTVFRGQAPGLALSADDLDVPDEINYTAGFAIQASPRITLNADLVGRTLLDVNRFETVSRSFPYRTVTGGPVLQASFGDVFDVESKGKQVLLLGVAGLKVNVARTLLLNASVLLPIGDEGLRPRPAAVVGLDYAF